jgi:hypothetical protein
MSSVIDEGGKMNVSAISIIKKKKENVFDLEEYESAMELLITRKSYKEALDISVQALNNIHSNNIEDEQLVKKYNINI